MRIIILFINIEVAIFKLYENIIKWANNIATRIDYVRLLTTVSGCSKNTKIGMIKLEKN